MTVVSSIKVKVQRRAVVKLKVLPRFPSSVSATSPILLDTTGGNYAISLDEAALEATLNSVYASASLTPPFGPRLAKTALYTVVVGDDGKTIALAGTAFYALTFPTASTLNATHKNVIVNEDTGRAKSIVLTGGTNFLLYPGQTAIVYNDNNVWKVLGNNRWRLTAAVTFNVDPTNGSDLNDGLSTGTGNAFLTIQKAYNVTVRDLDLNGQIVTIQLVDGTYSAGVSSTEGPLGLSTNSIIIKGNSGTPANVLVSTAADAFTFGAGNGAAIQVLIKDLKIVCAGAGIAISAWSATTAVYFSNVDFGAASVHISAQHRAEVGGIGNYTVSGNATFHAVAQTGGMISTDNRTITYSNSPVFTTNYFCINVSLMNLGSMTFTNGGTVTGTRYSVIANGVINTGGGAAGYLPGNVAGAAITGGQYV